MGFYSIGLGNLPINELSELVRSEEIPFLHLRGGRKGYNLAQFQECELEEFRNALHGLVDASLVTSDTDLQDFLAQAPERCPVVKELQALCRASSYLGANAVRLIGRRALRPSE